MAGKRGQYTAYDSDQVTKWKAAEVANRRQQRSRRGRRAQDASVAQFRPGMVRKMVRDGEVDGRHGSGDDHPGHPPDAA